MKVDLDTRHSRKVSARPENDSRKEKIVFSSLVPFKVLFASIDKFRLTSVPSPHKTERTLAVQYCQISLNRHVTTRDCTRRSTCDVKRLQTLTLDDWSNFHGNQIYVFRTQTVWSWHSHVKRLLCYCPLFDMTRLLEYIRSLIERRYGAFLYTMIAADGRVLAELRIWRL
jgi:hypothetical protein